MNGPRILVASEDAPIVGCDAPSGLVKLFGGWAVVKHGATVAMFAGPGSKAAAIRANGGNNVVVR